VIRALAAAAAITATAGVLVVSGPAKLHPGGCRHAADAASEGAAIRAYYDNCWARPSIVLDGLPPERVLAGATTPDGTSYLPVHRVLMRDHDGRKTIIFVGQREADRRWRVLEERPFNAQGS
jgi:hypothetical protein